MRQTQNTDQHSISWGCQKSPPPPGPISLVISTFCIHLEPGCESPDQIIHFHMAKSNKCPQKRREIFSLVLAQFLLIDPELFPGSLTCAVGASVEHDHGGGGGFFSPHARILREGSTNHCPPAAFVLKWRSARAHRFPCLGKGQSTVAQWAEMTVAECSPTS